MAPFGIFVEECDVNRNEKRLAGEKSLKTPAYNGGAKTRVTATVLPARKYKKRGQGVDQRGGICQEPNRNKNPW